MALTLSDITPLAFSSLARTKVTEVFEAILLVQVTSDPRFLAKH